MTRHFGTFSQSQSQPPPTTHSIAGQRGKAKTRIRRAYRMFSGGVSWALYTLVLSALLVVLFSENPVLCENPNVNRNLPYPAYGNNGKPITLDKSKEVACADYPESFKEIIRKEVAKARAKAEGKPVPVEEKNHEGECLNICDLCKTKTTPKSLPSLPRR